MKIINDKEIEERFHIKYFKCGSQNLCRFLYTKNIVPIGSFVSTNTGRMVWKYVDCKELDDARKEWSDMKNERYKNTNI